MSGCLVILPAIPPVPDEALLPLVMSLQARRPLVLTGAGVSTESGIPDYRGPITGKTPRTPMTFATFRDHAHQRQRYWARATTGWSRMDRAAPNDAHRALADLERAGRVSGVVTQNVDSLHARAGAAELVELHGALARVRCLGCDALFPRAEIHAALTRANPGWTSDVDRVNPDGDVDLQRDARDFRVIECARCGGVLKPDVVFFGENVRPEVLAAAWRLYDRADALLVVGSSLHVYSGRRFLLRAHKDGKPVYVVNVGPVRDAHLTVAHVDGRAADVLPRLTSALVGPQPSAPTT
jgi:NAD-dependent SIR2 family protein deacetylase